MSRMRLKAILCVFVLAAGPAGVFSAGAGEASAITPDGDYRSYLDENPPKTAQADDIVIRAADYAGVEGFEDKGSASYNSGDDILVLGDETGSVEWEVTVQTDGLYAFSIRYASLESARAKISFGIQVDGAYPYEELERLELARPWRYDGAIRSDSRGNNLLPQQTQSLDWQTADVYDSAGRYNAPLRVRLSEGKHTLSFVFSQAELAIDTVTLYTPIELPPYQTVYEARKADGAKAAPKSLDTIEAELLSLKSDSSILPLYDKSDAANQPVDARIMLLNTVGGTTWGDCHRWIEWRFDVEESGFYNIGMRVRQNFKYGANVFRRVYIDGETPFAELENVSFPYDPGWYVKVLGDGEPYSIYLSEGPHTLRMEVVAGNYEDVVADLEDTLLKLNNLYRNVMMITGPIPDPLRDYDLETGIPGLMNQLAEIKESLTKQKAYVERALIRTGSETAILDSLIVQINGFIGDTESIPFRLDSLKANISALADWVMKVNVQPLAIDYIAVKAPGEPFEKAEAGFFKNLWFSLKSIFCSFNPDYGIIGDYSEDSGALTVWMSNQGRDQLQTVKNLVDKSFADYSKAKVNLNLVQGGLIEAVLSGKGPDVSIFAGVGDPVNLAARGALTDLSGFEDFDSVTQSYYPNTLVPYYYNGGCYGLPVTQDFPMMYCRTDVLEELELQIPKTWDDLMRIAPSIQCKNLQIGIPSGISGAGMFPTLLMQRGSSYFTIDRSKTRFDEEAAIDAFDAWTNIYKKYGFPLQYDFFNRFRSGEMPIGIANYTMYGMLEAAAPEIRGLWKMVPVPGTVRQDGTVNGCASSFGGTAAILLKSSGNKADAWAFIKWFTSKDIQAEYGNAIEALLGPAGRYATANRDALSELPWSRPEFSLLTGQWSEVREVGIIPASYFVDRNISNAFKKVVYNNANPREVLTAYNFEINKEITRKNAEIGEVE